MEAKNNTEEFFVIPKEVLIKKCETQKDLLLRRIKGVIRNLENKIKIIEKDISEEGMITVSRILEPSDLNIECELNCLLATYGLLEDLKIKGIETTEQAERMSKGQINLWNVHPDQKSVLRIQKGK